MANAEFTDRVVLITGAVGNLGSAAAQAFRAAGAKTVLVDRSQERLDQAYADAAASDEHLLLGGVDLTDADSVDAVVRQALDKFGRLDVLVNTVGGFSGGPKVHEETLDTWDLMHKMNVRTTLLTCRAVVKPFLTQGSGRIINVAATAGQHAPAGLAAYSAAKSAVLRLSECLAAELKTQNCDITVNCVLPGTIDTPQNREAMPDADTTGWVEPAAIADVIVFFASRAARAVTGTALPVTGKG